MKNKTLIDIFLNEKVRLGFKMLNLYIQFYFKHKIRFKESQDIPPPTPPPQPLISRKILKTIRHSLCQFNIVIK